MRPTHQRLHLYTDGADSYIFAPTGESAKDASLTIQRSTGDIILNPLNYSIPLTARRSARPVYGIMGIIGLSMSEYVVLITGRDLRGRLMGHDVFRATDFEILPLNPNVTVQHPSHPVEAQLLALLRSHLYGSQFLFSNGWDLTRRLQVQWDTTQQEAEKAHWEVADDRFFWNRFVQTRLIEASTKQDLSGFILPVLYGTFDIRSIFLNGRHMQFCLISRRSRYRAGTRYFRRGVDATGHVANFNETEQMLLVEPPNSPSIVSTGDNYSAKFSFTQIRGSVPLFWSEINTLRYKPDLQVMELQGNPGAMKKHITEQVKEYGNQTLVNLVNHKGHEEPVKEAYERILNQLNLPQVRYEYFDFHNECKHMRWDRISILIDKLKDDLERDGYFHVTDSDTTPAKLQQGSVRTNCMDNLDRTNVVQAYLAKWTLTEQLRSVGILNANETVDNYEALSQDFREMWADHGDAIAKSYGGSGALKSDFTRTGKRTRKGLLDDGIKSVLRYLKNNYFDGPRQDAFDLFTGGWAPRKNPALSMFVVNDSRSLVTRSVPLVAFFSAFMIIAGLTLPRTSDYSILYYNLFWMSFLSLSMTYIQVNGTQYVSWPRFIPPIDPGYFTGTGSGPIPNHAGIGPSQMRMTVGSQWFKAHNRGESNRAGLEEGEKVPMGVFASKKRTD